MSFIIHDIKLDIIVVLYRKRMQKWATRIAKR